MGAPEGNPVPAGYQPQPEYAPTPAAAQPAVQQVPAGSQTAAASPVAPSQIDIDETKETSLDAAWVSRAKDIAMQYSSDPYEQSKQMSSLKSQFIKARYNKDVREAEE